MKESQKLDENRQSQRRTGWRNMLVLAIIIGAVIASLVAAQYRSHYFFSAAIRSSVNFPIYQPSSLPKGYTYDQSKTVVNHNTLFFYIRAGSRVINISEQVLPSRPPDLEALKKLNPTFEDLNLNSGNAISGTDSASRSPTVIIETNTTLISIQATSDTPSDVAVYLAKQFRSM